MNVIFVSECKKNAIKKTRKILDVFAERKGSNVWMTQITEKGINVIRRELAKTATKNTAVICYKAKKGDGYEIMWKVGNADTFEELSGNVPIAGTSDSFLRFYKETDWKHYDEAKTFTALASLLHDWGKCNDAFQDKIRGRRENSDPLRHEWVSLLLFGAFISIDPDTWRERFASGYIDEKAIIKRASRFNIESFGEFDAESQTIAWLILTHHKLPAPKDDRAALGYMEDMEDFWYMVKESWGYENEEAKREESLLFSRGIIPSNEWKKELSRWACKSIGRSVPGDEYAYRYFLTLCRLALSLGDHFFSSRKSAKPKRLEEDDLAANVIGKELMNQSLGDHLVGVRKESVEALALLEALRETVPRMVFPTSVRRRSEGRFSWQNLARDEAKRLVKENTFGFFCVNMAGTGSGKTFANVKIMDAVSEGKPRFSLLTGLRTLTLQTGEDYALRAGIGKESMSIVIGSSEFARLKSEGSESSASLLSEEVVTDYPYEGTALAAQLRDAKSKKALLPPILVATADHLVRSVTTLRGGKWIVPTLRILTSDLVIDEIDDFSEKDASVLARLVHLAGTFGRGVLVSSATITPDMAKGFYEAYIAGLRCFVASRENANAGCSVLWCDERGAKGKTVRDAEEFAKEHVSFTSRRKGESVTKRSAVYVSLPEKGSAEEYFEAVWEASKGMHALHSLKDEKSGKEYSIGLVRFSNVAQCASFGLWLSDREEKDLEIRFLVYHSSFPLITLHHTEKYLDSVLKGRKRDTEDPVIRRILDETDKREVLFVLVATPIEETGRDHDFDWCVIEPSSVKSVIQISGRVRRHREGESGCNVAIMRCNLKTFHEGDKPFKAFFQRPGYEGEIRLKRHDAAKIMPERFESRVDAVPRTTRREKLDPETRMDDLEHRVMEKLFTKGGYAYPKGWCEEPWYLTGIAQRRVRFREDGSTKRRAFVVKKDGEYGFYDEKGEKYPDYALGLRTMHYEPKNLWLKRDLEEILSFYRFIENDVAYGEVSWFGDKEKFYHDDFGVFSPKFL